jgi:hypothetical protein
MSAIISKCGRYRYRLERIVGSSSKTCLFIMLNPSTADDVENDNTIRRCIRFANSFGCGRLIVGNLFAFRTRNPAELKQAMKPEGPHNLRHLKTMCSEASIVIAAWGAHGTHRDQHTKVLKKLDEWQVPVHFMKLTKRGPPYHPLYLKGNLKPQLWTR